MHRAWNPSAVFFPFPAGKGETLTRSRESHNRLFFIYAVVTQLEALQAQAAAELGVMPLWRLGGLVGESHAGTLTGLHRETVSNNSRSIPSLEKRFLTLKSPSCQFS